MSADDEREVRSLLLFEKVYGPVLKELGCARLNEIQAPGLFLAQVAFLPSMEVRLPFASVGLLLSEQGKLVARIGRREVSRFEIDVDRQHVEQLRIALHEVLALEECRDNRQWLDGAELWGSLVTPSTSWETHAHIGNVVAGDRLRRLTSALFEVAAVRAPPAPIAAQLEAVFAYIEGSSVKGPR